MNFTKKAAAIIIALGAGILLLGFFGFLVILAAIDMLILVSRREGGFKRYITSAALMVVGLMLCFYSFGLIAGFFAWAILIALYIPLRSFFETREYGQLRKNFNVN